MKISLIKKMPIENVAENLKTKKFYDFKLVRLNVMFSMLFLYVSKETMIYRLITNSEVSVLDKIKIK